MPLYKYECETCGHVFEQFASVAARRLMQCEKCSGGCSIIIEYSFKPFITQPYYDLGFGKVVESYEHRKRLMKEHKVEEAGDIKHFDDIPKVEPRADLGNMSEFGEVWREVTNG